MAEFSPCWHPLQFPLREGRVLARPASEREKEDWALRTGGWLFSLVHQDVGAGGLFVGGVGESVFVILIVVIGLACGTFLA